ncbi:MAG TPA: VOC family protein [Thermomonospora sp.]|nr:VOC family protein [Thermomonospora sp.]
MAAGRSSREVGWPGWFDLASADPDTARAFYREVFGWYAYTLAVPDYGDYDIFTLGDVQGAEVAGMQALTDDTQPSSWMCYFRVEDLQATVEVVTAEGGRELIPPADYGGIGAVAVCMDPQGADFGVSLPSDVLEFGAMDEPSALCRVELACRDVQEARRFYGKVFGWRAVDREDDGHPHTGLEAGDRSIGRMVQLDERWPPHCPAHWIPYFCVDDCDATAARAHGLGARVHIPPTDSPPGRYAMITDPTGARFAVIAPGCPGVQCTRAPQTAE